MTITADIWMNLVERWFGHLDNKAIKRAAFLSVADLTTAIAEVLGKRVGINGPDDAPPYSAGDIFLLQ